MKEFAKFAAVGVAGYLIGFYEMKYKTMKSLLKVLTDEELEDNTDAEEEES